MELSTLEKDLLGDLASNDHSLHEVFAFVRLHFPKANDVEVLRIGRELIVAWIERGWLALAGSGPMYVGVSAVGDLPAMVDRLGADATRFFLGSPWIRLTSKARTDVEWLSPAS